MKFRFTKETAARLAANGKDWEKCLFDACLEAGVKKVKATEFCEALRASGFRCGTGPARAAFKVVRDGGKIKDMTVAIAAVKAKRKDGAGKDGAGKDGAGKDGAGKAGKAGKNTGTLLSALELAVEAAQAGDLEVVETWILKAQSILKATKASTALAIERMGGIVANIPA